MDAQISDNRSNTKQTGLEMEKRAALMEMKKARLLVAEDDHSLLTSLAFHLKRGGYEVLQAANGKEAMNHLIRSRKDNESVDLLIADIQMPEKSGFELVSDITRLDFDVPVLVMSGYGDKRNLLQIIRLGCEDFLEKPFEPGDLMSKVAEILTKRRRKLEKERESGRIAARDLDRLVELYKNRFEELRKEVDNAATAYRHLISLNEDGYKAQIACKHFPYKDLGGDFVGVRDTVQGVDVIVADVAGHDLAASHQAIMVKSFFDENSRIRRPGPDFFQILNKALLDHGSGQERMVTALFLSLDFTNMEGEVVSAGHPEIVRYNPRIPVARPVNANGSVLGLLDDVAFNRRVFSLAHGDRLFLYTDGILNASFVDGPTGRKHVLSEDGLDDLITKSGKKATDLKSHVNHIWTGVLDFCRRKHSDDMLLVGIQVP